MDKLGVRHFPNFKEGGLELRLQRNSQIDLPGVSLGCEDPLHEGFGGHPLYRQHGAPTFPVVTGSAGTKADMRN